MRLARSGNVRAALNATTIQKNKENERTDGSWLGGGGWRLRMCVLRPALAGADLLCNMARKEGKSQFHTTLLCDADRPQVQSCK